MTSATEWQVLGIDPAPSKDSIVFDGAQWAAVSPRELRKFVEERLRVKPRTLIAWDSPLSFGSDDFYDRTVDKIVHDWALDQVEAGRFEERAVNAMPFARVPHWVVSCVVLGHPFGVAPHRLRLAPAEPTLPSAVDGPLAIEVHPAVAIGVWWLDRKIRATLPAYKAQKQACVKIAALLQLDEGAGEDDDHLDACVAYHLGRAFLLKSARWLGSPEAGGYVLPAGSSFTDLAARFGEAQVACQRSLSRKRSRQSQ